MVCWVTSPIFHHPESRIRIMNVSFFFSAMCYPPLNQTLFTVESEARIRFPDFIRCRTILTGQNGRTQKQGNRWRGRNLTCSQILMPQRRKGRGWRKAQKWQLSRFDNSQNVKMTSEQEIDRNVGK